MGNQLCLFKAEINEPTSSLNFFLYKTFFNSSCNQWFLNVDVEEKINEFVIFADLPGVKDKEIEISIENNILLTIKGERKLPYRNKEKKYPLAERFSGVFYQRLLLPDYVDPQKIKRNREEGVLILTIPKMVFKFSNSTMLKAISHE